jgi:hypothetical protein
MLIEPVSNCVIEGERFQLSPDDVIEIYREREARAHLSEDAEFSRLQS